MGPDQCDLPDRAYTSPAVRVPNVPGWRGQTSMGQAKESVCQRTRQLPGRFRLGFGFSAGISNLVPCPVPTLITSCRGHTRIKDKRVLPSEGELGENSGGRGYRRGEERFPEVPGGPLSAPRASATHFYVCSNIT